MFSPLWPGIYSYRFRTSVDSGSAGNNAFLTYSGASAFFSDNFFVESSAICRDLSSVESGVQTVDPEMRCFSCRAK